ARTWTLPPAIEGRTRASAGQLFFFPRSSRATDSRDNRSALSRRRFSRNAFCSRSCSDNTFLLSGCLKTLWASRSAADALLCCEFISDSFSFTLARLHINIRLTRGSAPLFGNFETRTLPQSCCSSHAGLFGLWGYVAKSILRKIMPGGVPSNSFARNLRAARSSI